MDGSVIGRLTQGSASIAERTQESLKPQNRHLGRTQYQCQRLAISHGTFQGPFRRYAGGVYHLDSHRAAVPECHGAKQTGMPRKEAVYYEVL